MRRMMKNIQHSYIKQNTDYVVEYIVVKPSFYIKTAYFNEKYEKACLSKYQKRF